MVDEWNFNNVRDTDETVLMADTEEKDQDLPDEVLKESIKRGLGNNSKKTMCVIVSKKKKDKLSSTNWRYQNETGIEV